MGGKKVIGVLALQGAFAEHEAALRRCGAQTIRIRKREDLEAVDGLIIPGGESTAIGRLLAAYGLAESIVERSRAGMPVFGTCAGMIVMAKEISDSDHYTLGLMNISVRRNAFGRQIDSFEADLDVKVLPQPVRGIFIRAPYIDRVWGECEVLSVFDGKVVMAREKNLLTCSFHPELTSDLSIHKYFLGMV